MPLLNDFSNNHINSNIITKNIDDYCKNRINNQNFVNKPKYNTSTFYKDYIEHNILLIFIIIFLLIFLLIRYYAKINLQKAFAIDSNESIIEIKS